MNNIVDLVGKVVRSMAVHRSDVDVTVVESSDADTVLITVSATDMPRILGRRGKTYSAIKRLIELVNHPVRNKVYQPCGQLFQKKGTIQLGLPTQNYISGPIKSEDAKSVVGLVRSIIDSIDNCGELSVSIADQGHIAVVNVESDIPLTGESVQITSKILSVVSMTVGKHITINAGPRNQRGATEVPRFESDQI